MLWRHGELPLRFGNNPLLPFIFACFSCLLISSMTCFIVHYAYAMFIRLVIYMFSYFETPMFNMDLYLCVLTLLFELICIS